MRAARRLVAPILLAAATGCALQSPPAPEDTRKQALPNLVVPPAWASGAAAGPAAGGWLASFNDPQLEAMVREALANNPDLAVAAARVEQAAGFVKASGATLYPQVSVMARGGGRMGGDESGLQGIGVFASWELDLWGRVRAERATARQQ